jgi:nucleoside-diphosphate-sugar epimerase
MSSGAAAPTILITGAGGFIGSHLVEDLAGRGFRILGVFRRIDDKSARVRRLCAVSHALEMHGADDWSGVLRGVDVVIHAAAHVHLRRPSNQDGGLFHEVNVEGVRRLATACKDHRVSLFINLSSIAATTALPRDTRTYAGSKLEAEQVISDVFAGSSCRYVSLRLPAVYGPQMRGALAWLYRLVRLGVPVPMVADTPKRSYLSVWNLADCVAHCVASPLDLNVTVAIADSEALDLHELLGLMASATRRAPRYLPINKRVLAFMASLLGRERELRRAMAPCLIDPAEALGALGWFPRVKAVEGWQRTHRLAQNFD